MEYKDIKEYLVSKYKDIWINDMYYLYARYLKEKGDISVFRDFGDFSRIVNEVASNTSLHSISSTFTSFKQDVEYAQHYLKPFYEYVMSKYQSGDTIWDVGCGEFPICAVDLKQKGVDIVPVDPMLSAKFIRYFDMKYHKNNIEKISEDIVMSEPTMFLGVRPCEAFDHMMDYAIRHKKRVVTKPCNCPILDDDRNIIRGEGDKMRYYLSKYPALRLGSIMDGATPSTDNVGIETILESR